MRTRSRFAPSPTGYMHVGNLRSALFEYLIAKHDNGDFILRIEDTDRERLVEGATEFIYKTLELCNIKIDEGPNNPGNYGPYVQSERIDIYKKYAEKLVESGDAYYCFCSAERLNELKEDADISKIAYMYDGHCKKYTKEEAKAKVDAGEPYVIRQKMPKEGSTSYEDLVYGRIDVDNKVLEDQILIKSDGYPTYNFANVIDDHLMEITHVVRGNEYLSSTPKYLLLYKAFGWESPKYIHLPHIIKEGGKKLSKREGDASFMDLYEEGYLPEAIINYLALLGWTPPDNREIFSLDELVNFFNVKGISKAPAVYDIKKLRWINAHYIKEMPLDDFIKFVTPFLEKEYDLSDKDDEWLSHLLRIYQKHISYGSEIVTATKNFFDAKYELDEEAKEILEADEAKKVINKLKEMITEVSWDTESISEMINEIKLTTGIKGKMLFMPIRIASTGLMHGPELADTMYLFGRDKIIKNLEG